MAYYLRGCSIPDEVGDYVETIHKDFSLLVRKCISASANIPSLRDSNYSADGDKNQSADRMDDGCRLKITDLQLSVNPSCFSAFHHARRLTLKYKWILNQEVPSLNKFWSNLQASMRSVYISAQSTVLTSTTRVQKMVSVGIQCLVSLLFELNEKDPHVCSTALNSLLNLLNVMSVGELASEPKPVVRHLFQVLKQIRSSRCEEVASLACSCMVALCTAYGSTDLFIECATDFTSILWTKSSTDSVAVRIPCTGSWSSTVNIPENYSSLYRHMLKTLHGTDIITDWSNVNLGQRNVLDCLDMQLTVQNESVSWQHPVLCIASDGTYIYLMYVEGLVKIGSGFGQTKRGYMYASNWHIKSREDAWLGVSMGSLYLRRKHATKLVVLDCITLEEIAEVMLPASMSHRFLCNDGTQFSMVEIQESKSLLTITPLNEDFIPQEEEQIKLVLTEPKFLVLNDDLILDNNEMACKFGRGGMKDLVNFILTKHFSLALTMEGVCYLQGNGRSINLENIVGRWQEVKTQEKIKQMTLSPDERTLLLVSCSGRVFACTSQYFDCLATQRQNSCGPNCYTEPQPLKGYSNRIVRQAICNNDTIILLTENGKLFLHGKQSILCDQETKQVIGLEHVHVKQVAMGKMHTVVVTSQGHVYTFGNNSFGQCGCETKRHAPAHENDDKFRVEDSMNQSTPWPATSHTTDYTIGLKLCAPYAHVWKDETATICAACGMCSARGFECVYSKNRQRGTSCGCGVGLSSCSKCGICRNCGKRFGASGSEIDTGSDGQSTSLQTPYKLTFKSPGCVVIIAACGNYHTILRTSDGSVITFGSNRHGQLGVGDKKRYAGAQFVKLPPGYGAKQVHAGSNHCIIVCKNGTVYSFGKHHEGQLGRVSTSTDKWTKLGFVDGFATHSKRLVTFVNTFGNSTIIRYEQSLMITRNIFQGGILANRDHYIIIPANYKNSVSSTQLYMVDKTTTKPHQIMQLGLFSQNTKYKTFAIPVVKQSSCEDSQLGINMLACYYTLLENKLEFVEKRATQKSLQDSCGKVRRFQTLGGCWGYSMQSVEAIEFRVGNWINPHDFYRPLKALHGYFLSPTTLEESCQKAEFC